MKRQLVTLAHARSGDKGDRADLSLFAPDQATYELLVREVSAERVAAHFAGIATGPVVRYEVPNVWALKFVLDGALQGGASRSLRSDNLGKTLASALLRMEIEVDHNPSPSRGEEAP
ncbi:MAG: hypothetical protein ACK46X_12125 [Candidatus Sericytochromatia bacterium]